MRGWSKDFLAWVSVVNWCVTIRGGTGDSTKDGTLAGAYHATRRDGITSLTQFLLKSVQGSLANRKDVPSWSSRSSGDVSSWQPVTDIRVTLGELYSRNLGSRVGHGSIHL